MLLPLVSVISQVFVQLHKIWYLFYKLFVTNNKVRRNYYACLRTAHATLVRLRQQRAISTVEICRFIFPHDSHYLHTSKMFWV
jgi:hypothetical protein